MDDDRARPSLWRTLWTRNAYVMPHARWIYLGIYVGVLLCAGVVFAVLDISDNWVSVVVLAAFLLPMAGTAVLEARYRRRHPDAMPPKAPGRPAGPDPLRPTGTRRFRAPWPPSKNTDDYR